MTVYMKTKTDEYAYTLLKQDVADIAKGEWDEVGFKILGIVEPVANRCIFCRFLSWLKIAN